MSYLVLVWIRFSDEAGINICCTTSVVDPMKAYDIEMTKTENLTSFMQNDALIMDMGIVKNAGYSSRY